MATKTITVSVDENIKEQAEIILDDIGISITTLFNDCLKALVRENKIPFKKELGIDKHSTHKMPRSELRGILKGKVFMSDDFDEPLEEMSEYM